MSIFQRRLAAWLALFVLTFVVPGAAFAEKRVALVIGNSAYQKVNALPNPARDAEAIASMLKIAGFAVTRATDVGGNAMRRALRDFAGEVRDADIAAVFYAGHGIEVNGSNYLVPVDAVMERDIDVEDEAVPLDRVSQILEPAKKLRLIMLDACRDNPFVRGMKRTVATRSIGRGLAKVEVLSSDTLVAYAARAGSTADDGEGGNSPYTSALVKHLTTPGLDLRLAFGRVRDEVLKTTSNRQEPFVYGSLGGSEVALVAKEGEAAAPASPAVAAGVAPSSEAERAWGLAKDTTSVAVLEAFAARFKDTFYADLAKARIEELKKTQLTKVTPPPAAAPPPPSVTSAPAEAQPAAAAPAPAAAAPANGTVIPSGVFFSFQTTKQRLSQDGEFYAAPVRDPAGRKIAVVTGQIREGGESVGLLLEFRGKLVAMRRSAPVLKLDADARTVTLGLDNATEVLAALPEYTADDFSFKPIEQPAQPKPPCPGLPENLCRTVPGCVWQNPGYCYVDKSPARSAKAAEPARSGAECKGQNEANCSASNACAWIGASNGRTAYCRAAPK